MVAEVSWDNLQDLLAQWHQTRQRALGHLVFVFLEEELRLMFPSHIRNVWSDEMRDDVLQSFLSKLIERPLPQNIDHIRSYMRSMLRNHCMDHHRRMARDFNTQDDVNKLEQTKAKHQSDENPAIIKQELERRLASFAQLPISDRVVLKLNYACNWLEQDEMVWLAARSGLSIEQLRTTLAEEHDTYALSHIFDPGDDRSEDKEARRKRMERFRRRRSRAQARLNELYDDGESQ